MEWSFLQRIMLKMGLPEQWVNLAMETVCIASYSVLINGESKGLINPTRGIKQGDHLSPYLFLFCAEGLSSLIRKAVTTNRLKGSKVARVVFVSPTSSFQMIACYSVRLRLLNSNNFLTSLHNMRKPRVKQSTNKKPRYSSARTLLLELRRKSRSCWVLKS